MIENWRALFFTTLGIVLTLVIPYAVEKYRNDPISVEYSSVSFPIGSRGDVLFDTIANFIKENNVQSFSLPLFGKINVTPLRIKNVSNRRISNIEMIVHKEAIVIKHNSAFIGRFGFFPLEGARLERNTEGKIVVEPIDPSHVALYTIINGGFVSNIPVNNVLVDGKASKLNSDQIDDDIWGVKSFLLNNDFIIFLILVFSVFGLLGVFFIIYSTTLKAVDFEGYFNQFGKSQLKDARILIDYDERKKKQKDQERKLP
jgi:hypothetical protein